MQIENETSRFPEPFGALCEHQNYDSVSMQSSVVDSDFVTSEIRRFEAQNHYSNQVSNELNSNQINLQISVITPPTQGNDLHHSIYNNDKRFKETENNSAFNQKSNIKILQKPIFWICFLLFVCIVVGSTIGVIVVINLKKDAGEDPFSNRVVESTATTTSPSTSSSSTTTTKQTTTTSTETSTFPFVNPEPFSFFNRSEWNALPMKGKIVLKLPVKRIVLMDTGTKPCSYFEDCKLFMQRRQNSSYLSQFQGTQIQDIPENFLIAYDGSMFEGRGFLHEGQHTIDAGTSYNNGAVGISFIGNHTKNELSSVQKESLQYFSQKFVEEGKLEAEYIIYYKLQLIKSDVIDDQLYDYIKMLESWRKSPKIIRRSEWGAVSRSGSGDFFRNSNKKAIIAHSANSSCFELSECIDQVKQIQLIDKPKYGDIEHNFIFAGNDFIFEGRSFDISDSAWRGLEILFIGDFTEASPPQSLMNQLEVFLNYSVDLGKLVDVYDIDR